MLGKQSKQDTLDFLIIFLIHVDDFLPHIDQILTIYVKKYKYMSKIARDVIFSEKKAPAGMPTHRTGVDNIKNPLKSIQINQNQLKMYKINCKCQNQLKFIKQILNQLKSIKNV